MTARILAVDFRRGTASVLLLALLGLGGALVFSDSPGCDGRWGEGVLSLRQALGVLVPCVLAAGVWRGGSARRQGLDEAIAATPLPPWRSSAVEGGAIGLAGVGAFGLLLASLTVAGGCTADVSAGNAAAAIGASVLALQAAAFAGLALGRSLAAPMTAPLALFAGLVVTMVLGGWSPGSGWAMLLLPAVDEAVGLSGLSVSVSTAQMLWFAGLALSGWLLASRRPGGSRLVRLAPAAAGLAALVALSPG
jgi:hypothetical protein